MDGVRVRKGALLVDPRDAALLEDQDVTSTFGLYRVVEVGETDVTLSRFDWSVGEWSVSSETLAGEYVEISWRTASRAAKQLGHNIGRRPGWQVRLFVWLWVYAAAIALGWAYFSGDFNIPAPTPAPVASSVAPADNFAEDAEFCGFAEEQIYRHSLYAPFEVWDGDQIHAYVAWELKEEDPEFFDSLVGNGRFTSVTVVQPGLIFSAGNTEIANCRGSEGLTTYTVGVDPRGDWLSAMGVAAINGADFTVLATLEDLDSCRAADVVRKMGENSNIWLKVTSSPRDELWGYNLANESVWVNGNPVMPQAKMGSNPYVLWNTMVPEDEGTGAVCVDWQGLWPVVYEILQNGGDVRTSELPAIYAPIPFRDVPVASETGDRFWEHDGVIWTDLKISAYYVFNQMGDDWCAGMPELVTYDSPYIGTYGNVAGSLIINPPSEVFELKPEGDLLVLTLPERFAVPENKYFIQPGQTVRFYFELMPYDQSAGPDQYGTIDVFRCGDLIYYSRILVAMTLR